MKKTKIVCTLGPATTDERVLEDMLRSGMDVARLSGIKVREMSYLVYSFAGLLYGVAAIMLAARVGMAQPGTGEGYDMNAIAAAVIGGASLSGGRGAGRERPEQVRLCSHRQQNDPV